MKTTGVPAVFFSEESSELKTGNLKITMEMFLSSVIDTFNCELFKEREREREIFKKIWNAPKRKATAENSNND